jgi:hypothetical protein
LLRKLLRFHVTEDGPTAVENSAMPASIVLVCMSAMRRTVLATSSTIDDAASSLD